VRKGGLDFGFKHFIKFICVSYKPEFFNQFLNKILDFFCFTIVNLTTFFLGAIHQNFNITKLNFLK